MLAVENGANRNGVDISIKLDTLATLFDPAKSACMWHTTPLCPGKIKYLGQGTCTFSETDDSIALALTGEEYKGFPFRIFLDSLTSPCLDLRSENVSGSPS